jgi:Trk K+ transport system NAD-binding subunit
MLESAGIRTAHLVAAVTGVDEINLVATTLARLDSTSRAPSGG